MTHIDNQPPLWAEHYLSFFLANVIKQKNFSKFPFLCFSFHLVSLSTESSLKICSTSWVFLLISFLFALSSCFLISLIFCRWKTGADLLCWSSFSSSWLAPSLSHRLRVKIFERIVLWEHKDQLIKEVKSQWGTYLLFSPRWDLSSTEDFKLAFFASVEIRLVFTAFSSTIPRDGLTNLPYLARLSCDTQHFKIREKSTICSLSLFSWNTDQPALAGQICREKNITCSFFLNIYSILAVAGRAGRVCRFEFQPPEEPEQLQSVVGSFSDAIVMNCV